MKQFIKQYKKILIILTFPYVYMLFVLIAPTQQAVVAPGGTVSVAENIEIDGIEILDNFNTVYVYSYSPLTPFQSWVLVNDDTMQVYPMTERQKDLSMQDEYLQGQVSKKVSFNIALIKAYEIASNENAEISINYHYEGLYVYYRPSRMKDMQIGDQIVAVDGHIYSDYTHQEFMTLAMGNNVEFTIQRIENEEVHYYTVNYHHLSGEETLLFYGCYVIDDASPNYSFPGLNSLIGGPSGGLLQTLDIYASLVNINISDLKIAGTGTIEIDGNVGRIGGITQKMYTAIYNNVDVFFIPASHYLEIPDIDYPFEIVQIDTIEQAVNWLNEQFN
ncbi:MAG: hypothetical protein JXC31_01895 [Acholeplasmataceae bacterium]|nr:hypothetical protein [Acholeplasmataceae bacterium]